MRSSSYTMSVMSSINSVTAAFSCLIPSSDRYSSGHERVWEDRDEFSGQYYYQDQMCDSVHQSDVMCGNYSVSETAWEQGVGLVHCLIY